MSHENKDTNYRFPSRVFWPRLVANDNRSAQPGPLIGWSEEGVFGQSYALLPCTWPFQSPETSARFSSTFRREGPQCPAITSKPSSSERELWVLQLPTGSRHVGKKMSWSSNSFNSVTATVLPRITQESSGIVTTAAPTGASLKPPTTTGPSSKEPAVNESFSKPGGLDIAVEGTPGVHSVEAYRRTLTENGHDFERLTKSELLRRWPQWNIEDEVRATYQKDSGILDIRRACQTHIALAQGLGVIFKANTAVRHIESSLSGVTIRTDSDVLTADHVVLCAGAWTDVLLDNLGRTWNTKISQEQVTYFATSAIKEFSIGNFPMWVWHGPTMF